MRWISQQGVLQETRNNRAVKPTAPEAGFSFLVLAAWLGIDRYRLQSAYMEARKQKAQPWESG